ncbi:MAG TPA: exosortase [Verrucomicrobiae bacterium]|nr:exosortase [Verrucomicrobiae bacterium]
MPETLNLSDARKFEAPREKNVIGAPSRQFHSLPALASATFALVAAFAVPLWHLARFAAHNDLYSHILLIPAISAYLIWRKRKKLIHSWKPAWRQSALCVTTGAATIIVWRIASENAEMTEANSLALTTISFLFFFAGICFSAPGLKNLREIIFPIALLIFIVPAPSALTNWIETFLQHGSAVVAGALFYLSGMPALSDGLTIQLPGCNLRVEPECSGIHSTLALLITALLAGNLFLNGNWKRIILATSVVPLALLRNGLRIFVLGELCVRLGPDIIRSEFHRHGGILFFILSLVPLLLLLLFLRKFPGSRRSNEN